MFCFGQISMNVRVILVLKMEFAPILEVDIAVLAKMDTTVMAETTALVALLETLSFQR